MDNTKEKSAVGTVIPSAESKNNTTESITDNSENINKTGQGIEKNSLDVLRQGKENSGIATDKPCSEPSGNGMDKR